MEHPTTPAAPASVRNNEQALAERYPTVATGTVATARQTAVGRPAPHPTGAAGARTAPAPVAVGSCAPRDTTACMLGTDEAVIKDWEDIISINLTGVFNVTHSFLAPLRKNKGRIVNIGSIQSFVHLRTPSSPAYTASKHGVLGFTKALAAELGKDGVRVDAIGPGFIETPLNEKVRATNPDLVKVFMDHTPLGRAGKPEDIVGPAIFLASDLSAYVSGSIVMVDGGYRTL